MSHRRVFVSSRVSGVTPLMSVALYLLDQRPSRGVRVFFIWCAKNPRVFQLFASAIDEFCLCPDYDVRLFCTQRQSQSDCEAPMVFGRPSPVAILREVSGVVDSNVPVAVLTCGPKGLTNSVSQAVASVARSDGRALHLHQETFLF